METGDRKLNEVKKVTDMAYVPVIMADGSIGQIAKSDLASVVAGVMGISVNNIFPYKGELTADMESDYTLESGIYSQSSNPLTSVDGTKLYRGLLICLNNKNSQGNYYGTQFYLNGDGTRKYMRNIEYKSLGKWIGCDTFGYNSLAELAGGVADVIKPIMPLGSITGNIDEIVDCGAYMCEPSLTTSSFELPFEGDFSLYTFASSNLAYFKFQIAVDMSQNNSLNVKFRRFRSSWTQWQSVSFV